MHCFNYDIFYSPLPNKRMTVAVVDKQMDNRMESKECFGKEYENRENLQRSCSWLSLQVQRCQGVSGLTLCLQQVPVPTNLPLPSFSPCKFFTFTEPSASDLCRSAASVPMKVPPARHEIA